jgi:hypothetical protein
MSRTLYALYQQKVFETAKTLVVKHSEVARAINAGLAEFGHVTGEDPLTWKYYLNLAGEYHSTDTQMTILLASPTGPVEHDFTKTLLASHPLVKYEYRFGTRFYADLIRRYPEQQMLIDGILNPIDIDLAIAAADGDVLWCGNFYRRVEPDTGRVWFERVPFSGQFRQFDLIEDNETDLIPAIEEWIKGFLVRWHVTAYELLDELYVPAMLGVLYGQIPLVILNHRLAMCKTPQANSYHIREYLESHGKLAQYIPAISKKQALWLYRNVRAIETNVGKQETFEDLVQNIMTESRMPLAGYGIRHNLADLLTNITPDVRMVRETINFRQAGVGGDTRTVRDILDKEIPLGKDGGRDLDDVEVEITERMATRSLSNDLPTKVLESAVIDRSDSIAFPFADVLMNLWIYYAAIGKYDAQIFVSHPVTGERLQLTPLNALILFLYCYNKGRVGIELEFVPEQLTARIIPRQTDPSVSVMPPRLSEPSDFYAYVNTSVVSDSVLTDVIGEEIPEQTFVSNDTFYEYAQVVHRELMRRYRLYVTQEDAIARGHVEYAVSMMYWADVPVTLAPASTDYVAWLSDNGIDFTGMQQVDYVAMANELLRNGTGAGENTHKKLRELQTAVLRIMRQFSSYAVQYLQTINDDAILVPDWKTIRVSNDKVSAASQLFVQHPKLDILEAKGHSSERFHLGLAGESIPMNPREHAADGFVADVVSRLDFKNVQVYRLRIPTPLINVLNAPNVDQSLLSLLPNVVLNGFRYAFRNLPSVPVISLTGAQITSGTAISTLHAGNVTSITGQQITEVTGEELDQTGTVNSATGTQVTEADGYPSKWRGVATSRTRRGRTDATGTVVVNTGSATSSTGQQLTRAGLITVHEGDVQSFTANPETFASDIPQDSFELDNGDLLVTDGGDFFIL